jgi:hypothetical protein
MPEREELDLDCGEERTVRNFLGHKFWQGNRLAAPTNNHSAGAENSRAQEGCRIPQKNSEHLTHAAHDHEKAAKDKEIMPRSSGSRCSNGKRPYQFVLGCSLKRH